MLNNHFQHIFCINLPRRKDRRAEAEAEFALHNINVEFIDGVDGMDLPMTAMQSVDGSAVSRGDLGCTLSHLKVAQIAKERGLKNCFVFEDDAQLAPDFNKYMDEYIKQLPINWDMLYLGGNHDGGFSMIMPNLAKINHTYTTHAYAMLETVYDAVIEVLGRKNDKVDIGIASLHSRFNCYVVRPHLAWQRASFSDILEKHTDYEHLKK